MMSLFRIMNVKLNYEIYARMRTAYKDFNVHTHTITIKIHYTCIPCRTHTRNDMSKQL